MSITQSYADSKQLFKQQKLLIKEKKKQLKQQQKQQKRNDKLKAKMDRLTCLIQQFPEDKELQQDLSRANDAYVEHTSTFGDSVTQTTYQSTLVPDQVPVPAQVPSQVPSTVPVPSAPFLYDDIPIVVSETLSVGSPGEDKSKKHGKKKYPYAIHQLSNLVVSGGSHTSVMIGVQY